MNQKLSNCWGPWPTRITSATNSVPVGKGSAEIVLASESGDSLPYFADITTLHRGHQTMVFHKISSVAGWMGRENQGGWKIVLSSRCRSYIIVLYTRALLSVLQPEKKNSY